VSFHTREESQNGKTAEPEGRAEQYLATPGVVEEAERNLRMLDSVIRYLTVKVDSDIDITARPSEIDDTSYERAANTAADEEDMFLSRPSSDDSNDDDDDFNAEDGDERPGSRSAAPAAAAEAETSDDEAKE
jgi:hypothetical protein